MGSWVHFFNLAAASSGLVAALLGLVIAVSAPYVQRWARRYFFVLFTLLSAYIASDLVEQVAQYFLGPDFAWLAQAGVFLELLFSVAIIPTFTAYLIRCAEENWNTSPLFRCAIAFYVAYVAVLIAAQFGDAIYYFSLEEKCVLPGPFYPVLIVFPILLMVLNIAGLIRRKAVLTRRQFAALAICNLTPLVCVFLQAALFGLSVLVVGTSASALIFLGFVLAEQTDAHLRQLEEAAQRRAQVMALQMRPHFIYNVMTSIYYLCAQDPERAQQVTLDFTDYLRANFDAVADGGEVPFSKELEHTRAYLSVEQARLEDNLVVRIDCSHKAFRLPPLTLQPLVENAVKHGADPELPPLHVHIRTCEEPGFSVITVEDSGPGLKLQPQENGLAPDDGDAEVAEFFPADYTTKPNANPATALANIRERLAACGATLDIAPREGGGTIATIRVPAQECSA